MSEKRPPRWRRWAQFQVAFSYSPWRDGGGHPVKHVDHAAYGAVVAGAPGRGAAQHFDLRIEQGSDDYGGSGLKVGGVVQLGTVISTCDAQAVHAPMMGRLARRRSGCWRCRVRRSGFPAERDAPRRCRRVRRLEHAGGVVITSRFQPQLWRW